MTHYVIFRAKFSSFWSGFRKKIPEIIRQKNTSFPIFRILSRRYTAPDSENEVNAKIHTQHRRFAVTDYLFCAHKLLYADISQAAVRPI